MRLLRPPRPPSPQYELKEPKHLDSSAFFVQRQIMQAWVFASSPPGPVPSRPTVATTTLSTLHRHVLLYGLSSLQQRIAELVNLDLQFYHKYCSLLADDEVASQTYAYTGLVWGAAVDAELELMNREQLEWLLCEDVGVYERVVGSVRRWKGMIDARIGRVGKR